MKEQFLEAMQFRHACKKFDPSKEVADGDLRFLLEVGRLSPSSIGLEPWQFMVVRGQPLKDKLQAACWDQWQVGNAGVVVVILAKKAAIHPDNQYAKDRFLRRYGEKGERMREKYREYYNKINPVEWSVTQCHIAAANMMTAAAFIGIDSCPIGGFEPAQVMAAIGADPADFEPALVLPFGYRAKPPRPKQRNTFDEVVTFLD